MEMITTNQQFNNFLLEKSVRQYKVKAKDYHYCLFKIAYDSDCDFIHVIRIYNHNNPDGKPSLNDKSRLGGIFVYSLGLLFNIEYDLWCLLDSFGDEVKSLSVGDYYKQFCTDVEKEIVRRIRAGDFDRATAKLQLKDSDRDMEYILEYRERDSVERIFLEGVRLDKPDICISYDICFNHYDPDLVLRYLRNAAEFVTEQADIFMQENSARIYRQILRAEIQFEDWQKLEKDKKHPLHYKREIRRAVRAACVKTVNVTFERNGKSVTVKVEADNLGWCNTISDWNVLAVDRNTYKSMFKNSEDGDAKLTEITKITHSKKELYNKAEFEKTLKLEES